MALEERLVQRDVLQAADRLAGHAFEHPVDQQERIAVRQGPHDGADVERLHGLPCQPSRPILPGRSSALIRLASSRRRPTWPAMYFPSRWGRAGNALV